MDTCSFFWHVVLCTQGESMDSKKRYDLVVKLSEFYLKDVQKNLAGFNKARVIANISRCVFFISVFSALSIFIAFFALIFTKSINVSIYIPIAFFVSVFGYLVLFQMREIDKKNIIHVFKVPVLKTNDTSITLPRSADEEIKKHLMANFLKIFGDFEWCKGFTNNYWKDINFIKNLKILNNPIVTVDDCLSGKYNGVNVRIFEANTSVVKFEYLALIMSAFIFVIPFALFLLPVLILTLLIFLLIHFTTKGFEGVIVELDMNKKFEGNTFIFEKNNIKDNILMDTNIYEKVNLEDVEFSKEYNIYSENQIEARYVLTTAFIERLKNLKETYKAKYMRVAFQDDKIVILLQTGRDMFQMAGKSAITKETFVQLMDEIISVLDIVDILKLNNKLGL